MKKTVELPCWIGDKVRDRFGYVFTIEKVEFFDRTKYGVIFRCGNPGTEDYMAFYIDEIGEDVEILEDNASVAQ